MPDRDLSNAIIENLRLKSLILTGIFSLIFLSQITIIVYLSVSQDDFLRELPKIAFVVGPCFLMTIIIAEIFFRRKLRILSESGRVMPGWLPYSVTFIESTFPTTFIIMAGQFLKGNDLISPQQLITSPPLIMYIVMIILSSLMLDLKISVFAGIVSGIEYVSASLFILGQTGEIDRVDLVNVVVRGGLIFFCGVIAGLISKKTREAVQSSLEHKNTLIHKLDHLVAEKTREISEKNGILEEKQREIMDSMHYAKRIQDSQLPSEKQVGRNLDRLKS